MQTKRSEISKSAAMSPIAHIDPEYALESVCRCTRPVITLFSQG